VIKSILFFEDSDLQNNVAFAAKLQGLEFASFVVQKVCEFIEQKYKQKITAKNEADFYMICKGFSSKEGLSVAVFIERACARMVLSEAKPGVRQRIANFLDLNATIKEMAEQST
jgi:hypothetical protein